MVGLLYSFYRQQNWATALRQLRQLRQLRPDVSQALVMAGCGHTWSETWGCGVNWEEKGDRVCRSRVLPLLALGCWV